MPHSTIDVITLAQPLRALLSLVLCALLLACGGDQPSSAPGPAAGSEPALSIDYPLENSVFPPDFAPPTFLWHDNDSRSDTWRLTLAFADGGEPLTAESSGPPLPRGEIDTTVLGPTNEVYEGTPYQRSAHAWKPGSDLWAKIRSRSVEGPAVLTIAGFAGAKPDEMLTRGLVAFSTSTDPVGAPIFYRDVPLMPAKGKDGTIAPLDRSATHTIAWRLRDVSLPDSKLVLAGMPTCANCHSFSLDGKTLGMDVDGPEGDKGTYTIAPLARRTIIGDDEIITWNSFQDKPAGHKTIGFLSRISPDGTYALTTLNEALYVSNFTNYKFLQVFYPTRGILAWYSKRTGEMKALPGADDTEYVHCSPVWFPNGKEIVFARARAFDPYLEGQPKAGYAGDPNEPRIQFDLYHMPFGDGEGGTPVPIEGASQNGMSNTFPKISPDGKWLVYTKCENGLLMRPDGRLWIVPSKGGEAREMKCNTSLMNSWHSFSPNSRWMVFSSKINTPYTQMFLTHIDEDGNDTPPILIENSTAANRAVNIPEFVDRDFHAFDTIEVPAVNHFHRWNEGLRLIDQGRFEEAIPVLEQAIEKDPEFAQAMVTLGYALLEAGRIKEAREKLLEAIEVDPRSALARVNLGLTFLREGRTNSAAEQFEIAITIDPTDRLAHQNLGLVRLEQGSLKQAHQSLTTAVKLEPENADARAALGQVLYQLGREQDAVAEYRAALRNNPDHAVAHSNLAGICLQRGDAAGALIHLRKSVEADPLNTVLKRVLCNVLLDQNLAAEAMGHFEEMLEAAPNDPGLKLSLAWFLSTLPDDSMRDGPRAVRLAEQCLAGEGEHAHILDVLAAAYAEAGRFPEAVKTATRALELQRGGAKDVAPGLPDRLKQYRAGRPHRQ